MIHKLKRKFILLATVSMLLLMAVLVAIMNLINYSQVVSDSDSVLDVLAQPNAPFLGGFQPPEDREEMQAFIPPGMSPEVPYESRFFTVTVSPTGEIMGSDLSRIISVDSESLDTYISDAAAGSSDRGFIGHFRYLKSSDGENTRILFLDCGRKLDAFRSFLWTSIAVGLLGCVVVFVVFMFTAGKIIAPIAESYEKQKRFISDAGHEIKTPLTIINANVDLLETDGEKEELTDIRAQTKRLTELTNNLVLLSKMEEAQHTIQKIDMPLSDLIGEAAGAFRALAASRHLDYRVKVEPNISFSGSPDAIRQLATVLLDNAMKYAPEGGKVTMDLSVRRRTVVLTVCNTTAEPVRAEDLPQVFDRFYRTDASRNSQTGGHGIGLSIAKAITEAHSGSISAGTKTGRDFRVTVTLPL